MGLNFPVWTKDNGIFLPLIMDWEWAIMDYWASKICTEHSTRVPFIVSGPGVPKTKRFQHQSIFRTSCPAHSQLLEEVSLKIDVQFNDIMPLVMSKKPKPPYKEIYGAYLDAQRSITVGTKISFTQMSAPFGFMRYWSRILLKQKT